MSRMRTSRGQAAAYLDQRKPCPAFIVETDAISLTNSIVQGDRMSLQNLLRSGVNPNGPVDEFGTTPMHVAAGCEVACGAWMLEEMMREGGNPNIRNAEGLTPVHLACMSNRVACLRALIEHGGDPLEKCADNRNAKGYAQKYNALECISFLTGFLRESSRPVLSTLNEGPRMQRQNSGTSLASQSTQYHSACSSPTSKPDPILRQAAAYLESKKQLLTGKYPDADYDSDDAYFSPPKKAVFKQRSTSGTRDVPRSSRTSQPRFTQHAFSSDSEDEGFYQSRSSSKTRAPSLGRIAGSKASQWQPVDEPATNGFRSLSKPSSRTNSSSNLHAANNGQASSTSRVRRASGKENDTRPTVPDTTDIVRQELAAYAAITDHELRQQLQELGFHAGPITSSSSRAVYIKRLILLKRLDSEATNQPTSRSINQSTGCSVSQAASRNGGLTSCRLSVPRQSSSSSSSVFCQELEQVITGSCDKKQMAKLEADFAAVFRDLPPRSYHFNYLLIDPRITQNLPHQVDHATEANVQRCLRTFLRGVFYIGKGKDARPCQHLVDAKRVYRDMNAKTSPKLDRICSIWENAYGIVSLNLFDHRSDEEASSREALMIEALGLTQLTNERHATAHETIKKWSGSRRRLLGSAFLVHAFQSLLHAGEQQIFPEGIRS
ncbi:putative Ankyrin repeat and LEM domain-containing protein 1 [Hypsibius exemplaris]|uniref:Ankyrin repeat and LEM domain-containing protein 1 n=1 Tax=Hypsibius exemplaris TaxID=2072580 RepID=A0A1W0WAQ2_HYPEX|nr:putative Ankyrin repeat and LEM domain-containing protein 1 [Hypsibius exemplaris]